MSTDISTESARLLSEGSPLAEHINGFCERTQQKEMAIRIAEALSAGKSTFIAEAGTGNGKTLAYLIPAVLSKKRTIVSTYTRHLQDQIYFKDLPMVLKVTGQDCNISLLKGRSNYLCIERLEQTMLNPSMFNDDDILEGVKAWSRETTDGDLSLFSALSEKDPLRSQITSTAENCLGSRCPHYNKCFVAKAREKANKADLVIVNHNILISDMVLKVDGFGELLPDVQTIIVDEAHKLKTVSEQSFSDVLASGNVAEFLREINDHLEDRPKDSKKLADTIKACNKANNKMVRNLSTMGGYKTFRALLSKKDIATTYQELCTAFEDLKKALKPLSSETEILENFAQRTSTIHRFLESIAEDDSETLTWVRSAERSFRIYRSPLDVSQMLAKHVALYKASWIYTSATLTVSKSFEHFLKSQGLPEDSDCNIYSSPFDYAEQACLYLPPALPEPNHPEYISRLIETASPLFKALRGRSFMLFTSYKNMQEAYEILQDQGDYELLLQGEASKMDMIERFGDGEGRLLLGTSSFWEGVDVRGPALSCIVIDKLPFASPADPLTQARMKLAAQNDINYFVETSLLEAVIMLRQGVGRLIRSETDQGVVLIGDKRITTKSYGKAFLNSLPPMKVYKEMPPKHFLDIQQEK